jgi:RNA polymerase sigma factor (sigma-70 family)
METLAAESLMAVHKNDPRPRTPPEPLEQAYEQYRAELRRFFKCQLREPQTVDDLMQMVVERLLRYPPQGVLRQPQRYLYRIAWRVLNEANRRAQREQRQLISCDVQELEALADEFGTLWTQSSAEEDVEEERLESVLCQLPKACQVALLRQRRDGLSYKDIAAELGVSVHTVKSYIVRALEHFRTHFQMNRRER